LNPSTAFAVTFADELARCGLREVVLAPGSRSTPLAMAFGTLEREGRIRLHVRVDERSASFTALGLAKASRAPVAVVCTSGTAAANFHPAVIEADESGVPLLVLTADRPPELRATGANQTIDQIKLYGGAVRWFCEAGVPEASVPEAGVRDTGVRDTGVREAGGPGTGVPAAGASPAGAPAGASPAGVHAAGQAAYWRSLACRTWAHATGIIGGFPGPVHLNIALRDPLVPDGPVTPLPGRPDGAPWTRFATPGTAGGEAPGGVLDLPWTERGVVICGDGDDAAAPALLRLAEQAGWPVLAEPSSGARRGPNALTAYQYLLSRPDLRPDLIVSAGRPGLSRAQQAFLGVAGRHVVLAQGPGRWADPQRTATDVTAAIRLTDAPAGPASPGQESPGQLPSGEPNSNASWLARWLHADRQARAALDQVLDSYDGISEPRLARDLIAALPEGALLWTASSMPVRDADSHMPARDDIRVLASRGASGIDGTISTAAGAALAHDGPAFALIGDLAFLHDTPGLVIGPREPRPDLCLVVVNNDGGGIFSTLEQAAFDGFERLFATPHGTAVHHVAAAFGLPYHLLDHPDDLGKSLQGTGLRVVEVRTDREAGAELRARLRSVANALGLRLAL
jgi:2-succinyl-5-enolpyruvyl-6-hydroxy-3-cyclohexene-1-carboxylate synthase